jgi:hypothetical protein
MRTVLPLDGERCVSTKHLVAAGIGGSLMVVVLAVSLASRPWEPPQQPAAAQTELLRLGSTSVRVSRSSIPGAGLGAFALRDWEPGEEVGVYSCKVVSKQGSDSQYSWAVNSTHRCDGRELKERNPLRYLLIRVGLICRGTDCTARPAN